MTNCDNCGNGRADSRTEREGALVRVSLAMIYKRSRHSRTKASNAARISP